MTEETSGYINTTVSGEAGLSPAFSAFTCSLGTNQPAEPPHGGQSDRVSGVGFSNLDASQPLTSVWRRTDVTAPPRLSHLGLSDSAEVGLLGGVNVTRKNSEWVNVSCFPQHFGSRWDYQMCRGSDLGHVVCYSMDAWVQSMMLGKKGLVPVRSRHCTRVISNMGMALSCGLTPPMVADVSGTLSPLTTLAQMFLSAWGSVVPIR